MPEPKLTGRPRKYLDIDENTVFPKKEVKTNKQDQETYYEKNKDKILLQHAIMYQKNKEAIKQDNLKRYHKKQAEKWAKMDQAKKLTLEYLTTAQLD